MEIMKIITPLGARNHCGNQLRQQITTNGGFNNMILGINVKSVFRPILLSFILMAIGCTVEEPPVIPTWTPKPPKEVFLPTLAPNPTARLITSNLPLPPEGYLYHGVYPGGDEKEDVTLQALRDYENAVGKKATWVYFSTYWFQSREFPEEIAGWIRDTGSIPYIRLMLQSGFKFEGNEPVYTLDNILAGQIDDDLHSWCVDARNFGTHLLAEYGTEVNSDSFPWSGVENGAGRLDSYGDPSLPDGPERFQDAYRRIIKICQDAGALNITWVFHADSDSYPDASWNKFEYYYPGDEWIDWIGISIYGAHTPMEPYHSIFRNSIERVHPRILKLAPDKPIIITEFGSAKNNSFVDQAWWADNALTTITSMKYKNLIGFAWWNEAWQNDGNPAHDTTMRVQDNPELENLFKEMVGNNPSVIGRIAP
jgi:hypothetical protein